MSASLYKTFAHAYGITSPWGIHTITKDVSNHDAVVLHVSNLLYNKTIIPAVNKSWFKRKVEQPSTPVRFFSSQRWRAHPIGLKECYIQIHLYEGEDIPNLPWCNTQKKYFTQAYEDKLIALITGGLSLTDICKSHDLPLQQVWSLKFHMLQKSGSEEGNAYTTADDSSQAHNAVSQVQDNSSANLPTLNNDDVTNLKVHNTESVQQHIANNPPHSQLTSSSLPATQTDTNHSQLLTRLRAQPLLLHPFIVGEIELKTNDFGLQLLLSQLQRRILGNSDSTTILMACDRLSMYLIKNASRLPSLLDRLQSTLAISIKQHTPALQLLPDQNHQMWQDILDNHASLNITSLSLQLLLTQLKRNPDKAKQVHELRRFFQMNYHALGYELEQLGRTYSVIAPIKNNHELES